MPNNRGKNYQRGRGNQHGLKGNKSNYAGPRSNGNLVNGSNGLKPNQSQQSQTSKDQSPCPFLTTNGCEEIQHFQNSSKFSQEEMKVYCNSSQALT